MSGKGMTVNAEEDIILMLGDNEFDAPDNVSMLKCIRHAHNLNGLFIS
jgi:hypothetical protein